MKRSYPDGSTYVGDLVWSWKRLRGNRHGQGTHTYSNGREYVGEWKNDRYHGQGTWTHPDGGKYVGEWENGYPIEQGTNPLPEGLEYESEDWIEETDEDWIEEQSTRYIPSKVRREVWRRDQGRCSTPGCGSRKNLEFDHIIPFSEGGSNTVRNIELLCEECNRKKSNNIE